MRFKASTLALVTWVLASPAMAQVPSVLPGELLRIYAPSLQPGPLVGRVIEVDDTRFRLLVEDRGEVAIPREAVARLQWSPGPSRRVKKGAVLGTLVGALLLGLSGAEKDEDCIDCTKSSLVAVGAISGAMWGAGIGALVKRQDWHDMATPSVATGRQRALVGVSLRF